MKVNSLIKKMSLFKREKKNFYFHLIARKTNNN
jgi:hypothetical protein